MPQSTEPSNLTLDMTQVGRAIRKLHDHVVGARKRVEITRAGCEDICVMISKSELESLEQALSILADTEGFTEMCDNLKRLLERAGMVSGPTGHGAVEAGEYAS
jgi:hypothetical protein